jgi:peptidoglycan hydrolase-like protein with peptidoglycan-binding domain
VTTYPNPTKKQILAAFDAHGVRYKVEPVKASAEGRGGWPNGLRALIDHHTAGRNSLAYLMNAGGTYPLVNTLIDRDGLVHILSTQSCWGTGSGGPWPGIAAKDSLHLVGWSTEVEDLGQGRTFTDAQIESLGRQNAALVSLGVPATNEINHRDWTDGTNGVGDVRLPTAGRKIDTRYDTTWLRANTLAYKVGSPTKPPEPPKPKPPTPSPSWRQGKKVYSSKMRRGQTNSDSVWNITVALKAKRYWSRAFTDDYTDAVVQAVRAFQKAQGWSGSGADGIVGPQTAKRLGVAWVDDGKPSGGAGPSKPSHSYRQGEKVYSSKMKAGQQGSDSVWNLQVALIAKGYSIPDGPTEFYGPQTVNACKKFQQAQGWKGKDADGIAGQETVRRLGLQWVKG